MFTSLLNLFIAFFKVGAFSFGGAYSLIPLIEREAVMNNQWLTNDEFLKILGMVDVFPGAISIKFATYIGYKTAGIPGALAANLGNFMVPGILMVAAFMFYSHFEKNEYVVKAFKGVKYVVVGMVIGIMSTYLFKTDYQWQNIVFVAIGLVLILVFKLHPAYVVIVGSIIALLIL
jgi:chromate transporter